jgi:hypothetical protein
MSSIRKTALIAGALFVITFLTSIPAALLLYTPVLDHAQLQGSSWRGAFAPSAPDGSM